MRRKVGVSAVKKRQEDNDQFSKVGKDLEESKLSKVQEVLTNFKTTLSEFAAKHKDKIISDPEFRQQFHTMCVSVGVDPLASSKGFWADMLGVGDFYFELGVKIIEVSVKSRSSNGGIMSMKELIEHLNKTSKVEVSSEDVHRSVEKLSVLGNGFRIIEIAGSPMVCSVPLEVNVDHEKLFAAAQLNHDFVTLDQMQSMYGWTEERFYLIINPLLSEGMAWVDIHDGKPRLCHENYLMSLLGETSYCFPSLWKRD